MSEIIPNESDERLKVSAVRDTLINIARDLLLERNKLSQEELQTEDGRRLGTKLACLRDSVNQSDEKLGTLIQLLRKLRGHLAHSKQVKPYVIFPDEVLIQLVGYQPETLAALAQVKGFPEEGNRIQKWGPAVVAIFGDKEVTDFEISTDAEGEVIPAPVMKRMQTF